MSFKSLREMNYIGISIFTFGILIQTILNIKKKKKVSFSKFEIISTDFDETDFDNIIDEPYGFNSSNPNNKLNLKEDDQITNENMSNTSNTFIKKINEKLYERNDKNVKNNEDKEKNVDEKLEELLLTKKILEYKSDVEVAFLNSNPDEIIIKIICPEEEKINWGFELEIKKILSKTSNKNINLILESNGGNFTTGMQICNTLYIYKKLNPQSKIKVYVPSHSLSAGTLIALMADELYLNDYAFLSPVDVQIMFEQSYYSVNEIIEYSEDENSKVMNLEHNSLIMACCAKRYINASIKCFNKFIFHNCNKYNPKTRKIIIDKFVRTKLPHSISFDKEDIEESGIKINGNVPIQIIEIYEQAIKLI